MQRGGQVYNLRLHMAHMAPHPIGLHQPIHAMVAICGAVAFLRGMSLTPLNSPQKLLPHDPRSPAEMGDVFLQA